MNDERITIKGTLSSESRLNLIKLIQKENLLDHTDPSNSAIKPAWKSTEFWMSLSALVIGYVLTSGVLDTEDASQAKIIKGLVAVAGILGALGYTGLRTSAKNKAVEGAVALAIAKEAVGRPTTPASP